MSFNSAEAPHRWQLLNSYSACDISDALLKLQTPAQGEVPRAGYLADIVPYAPNSPFRAAIHDQPKIIAPASTLKLVARNSTVAPLPETNPCVIPNGRHWADMTDEGTVLVIEQPEGQRCAAIGGILALRLKARGLKGCVVDGRVRDLEELSSCGFPVWARGRSTVSAMAEAQAYARNSAVSIGGVQISPGDIIFCDPLEGLTAIPRELVNDVLDLMPKLLHADERIKEDVRKGASVTEAFKMHRD